MHATYLLLAFVLIAGAQSPPSPKQREQQNKVSPTQSSKQAKQKPAVPTQNPPPDSTPSKEQPCADQQGKGEKQSSRDRYDIANAVFAGAVALFTACTGVLIFWQIRDYRRRERAFVIVGIDPHPIAVPTLGVERFTGTVKNAGDTPARVFAQDHVAQQVPRGTPLPTPPIYETLQQTPREEQNLTLAPDRKSNMFWNVDENTMRRVKSGEVDLYLFGRVRYRDIFRRQRETRYCYRYYPPIPGSNDPRVGCQPEGPPEYTETT